MRYAATEKHVPVVERTPEGVKVTIGSVAHPMTEKHYIEWIELIDNDTIQRRMLNPGDEPTAIFGSVKSDSISARAYCNIHGLWKS